MKEILDYHHRTVRLTDERLQHILEHPEMVGLEDAIEQTIREPASVIRSRSDAEVSLNYRFYSKTRVGDKWLCVVIKYRESDAFVVTAYLTDKIKAGEQIWPPT